MNKAMSEENTTYLKELAQFLTADAWSEDRIQELLANVWVMGYEEGKNVGLGYRAGFDNT